MTYAAYMLLACLWLFAAWCFLGGLFDLWRWWKGRGR